MKIERHKRVDELIKCSISTGKLAYDIGSGGMKNKIFEEFYEHKEFVEVIGIDIYEDNAKERNEFYKHSNCIKFVCCDATKYQFAEADLVTMFHSAEHMNEKAFKELIERLKKTTRQIIVETPDEYEDGNAVVVEENNPHQRHAFLVTKEIMISLGFEHLFTYAQNHLFNNSVYIYNNEERT